MNIDHLILSKIHKFILEKNKTPKRIVMGWRDKDELISYLYIQYGLAYVANCEDNYRGLKIKLAKCERYIRIV